jgi:hypothetical protein
LKNADRRAMKTSVLIQAIHIAALVALTLSACESQPVQSNTTQAEEYTRNKQILADLDAELLRRLESIRLEAISSRRNFSVKWREGLKRMAIEESPLAQRDEFRDSRKHFCIYSTSLALEGSGFANLVLACEIDLTKSYINSTRLVN